MFDHCPTCGVPWPPSLADDTGPAGDRSIPVITCMEPEHPHPGRRHWHRSGRTGQQLLEWS